MRFSTGAWRWLIVPTITRDPTGAAKKRGASAPKRATSKRGLATAMNSIAQQAVMKGYWKSEYFLAQLRDRVELGRRVTRLIALERERARGTVSALPFEGSFFPDVCEGDDDDGEEAPHLGEARPAERSELDRPRVDEDGLDVEDDEEDGLHVELESRTSRGGRGALGAALERQHLLGVGFFFPQIAGEEPTSRARRCPR